MQTEYDLGQALTWPLPFAYALHAVAAGRLDEHTLNLRGYAEQPRSHVMKAVLATLATRYVDGPSVATAELGFSSRDQLTAWYRAR